MNIVAILAGGVGQRMGMSMPKQFLVFDGKTCLEHTISRFNNAKNIDQIVIAVHPDWIKYAVDLLKRSQFECQIIPAGNNRSQSSYNALNFIDQHFQCDNVLIHDAVRPFVTDKLIDSCLVELNNYDAVTVAVPVTETVIGVDNGFIKNIPDRRELFINQTPQAFKFQNIKQVYDMANNENRLLDGFSDDCSVFLKYFPEKKIKIIPGEYK
ncbi:MAG: 2-C-methyl-D-erythritol 4-phosphate cytidylyltransferase, partial [Opitutales bacterium]|nr:2-C-methyl-D-erythritol 4-phosphate cytidylyltransferase [Opitutales bacterium]